jgi:hypothetical protein
MRRLLLNIRAWIREIKDAIQEEAKAEHISEEEKRNKQFPPDKVRVIVSLDDETVRSTQSEANRQHATQNSIRNATWTAVVAASIYALISLLIWCQMVKQSRIASAALQQSTESFRVGERAWVGVAGIGVRDVAIDWSSVRVQIDFKNAGRSPARDVTVKAGAKMLPYEMVSEKDFADVTPFAAPDLAMGKAPLLPEVISQTPIFEVRIAPYLRGDLKDGKQRLYIAGIISYVDIFGSTRITHFCGRIDARLVRTITGPSGIPYCNAYNDMN